MSDKTFLGTPCKRGHDGLRYKVNGACVLCTAENQARRRTARKQQEIADRPSSTEVPQQ